MEASASSKPDPKLAAKLKADADNPDEVRKALDDAAGMSRNLWLAFLSFGTYLVIAVGSVTHRDLFLETPIKLPLLDVNLPLVAFFVVAPLLFLIFHAYLLLNLRLLVDNVRRYNEMLERAKLQSKENDSVRLLLTNFPFVQLLAGTSDSRRGLIGWLLTGIVWITVVFAPVVLLLLMQLKFLPYHHDVVTWVHRGVIVADLVLLWLFWPSIVGTSERSHVGRLIARASNIVLTALILIFAMLIATFPGEPLDRNVIASASFIPSLVCDPAQERGDDESGETAIVEERGSNCPKRLGAKSAYELLFSGRLNEVRGTRHSVWDNTLVLPDQDFVDDERLDKVERTVPLRGRDLRGAVLVRADLRKADFTGATLEGAQLYGAKFDQANFGCGRVSPLTEQGDEESVCTSLAGANLIGAFLRDADLDEADLRGAKLSGAYLALASIRYTHLQGADLTGAWLLAASLDQAYLQGASLRWALLQGAKLDGANFEGASLNKAAVWRSKYMYPDVKLADIATVVPNKVAFTLLGDRSLDSASVIQLMDDLTAGASRALKRKIVKELSFLRSDDGLQDKKDVDFWDELKSQQLAPGDYETQLSGYLAQLGCAKEGSPFVAQGLISNGRVEAVGSRAAEVEAAWFDEDRPKCAGVMGMPAALRSDLHNLVEEAQPVHQEP